MLLNIFFDNMNPTLELVLIGAFIMAFYWFVYAVFLYGWPGERPIVLPRDAQPAL